MRASRVSARPIIEVNDSKVVRSGTKFSTHVRKNSCRYLMRRKTPALRGREAGFFDTEVLTKAFGVIGFLGNMCSSFWFAHSFVNKKRDSLMAAMGIGLCCSSFLLFSLYNTPFVGFIVTLGAIGGGMVARFLFSITRK